MATSATRRARTAILFIVDLKESGMVTMLEFHSRPELCPESSSVQALFESLSDESNTVQTLTESFG